MESVAIVFGDERQADGFFFRKPFVVPELKEWKPAQGSMTLGSGTRIVYDAKQPELLRIAKLMADDCFRLFQRKPEVVSGKAKTVISYWH